MEAYRIRQMSMLVTMVARPIQRLLLAGFLFEIILVSFLQ